MKKCAVGCEFPHRPGSWLPSAWNAPSRLWPRDLFWLGGCIACWKLPGLLEPDAVIGLPWTLLFCNVKQMVSSCFLRFHTNFHFVIFVQVGDTYPFPPNNINKAHRNAGFCSVFVHFGIPGSNFLLNSIVLRTLNLQFPDIFMIWVCLKMSCSPKPNGFADQTIPMKNGYFIIPNIFSYQPIFLCVWMGKFQSMLVFTVSPWPIRGGSKWRRSRLREKRQRALRRWRVAFCTVSLARSLMVQVRNGEKWWEMVRNGEKWWEIVRNREKRPVAARKCQKRWNDGMMEGWGDGLKSQIWCTISRFWHQTVTLMRAVGPFGCGGARWCMVVPGTSSTPPESHAEVLASSHQAEGSLASLQKARNHQESKSNSNPNGQIIHWGLHMFKDLNGMIIWIPMG